jgi:transcriptional regulator with XRE-family HTH domain
VSIEVLSYGKDFLVRVTSQQVKAARALLGWTSVQLADAAGIGKATVWRLESVDGPLGGEQATVDKIVGALQAAGIEFSNGAEPGVRLRAAKKPTSTKKSKPVAAKSRRRNGPQDARSVCLVGTVEATLVPA